MAVPGRCSMLLCTHAEATSANCGRLVRSVYQPFGSQFARQFWVGSEHSQHLSKRDSGRRWKMQRRFRTTGCHRQTVRMDDSLQLASCLEDG